jgi:hypothetical protein
MDPSLVLAIQTSRQGINLLLLCCCWKRVGGGDDTDQDEESWMFDDSSLWDESWLITDPEDQTVSSEEDNHGNIPMDPHCKSWNQERTMNCEHLATSQFLTNREDRHTALLSFLFSLLTFKSDRRFAEEEFILCPWKY